jgi:hypothetical protein
LNIFGLDVCRDLQFQVCAVVVRSDFGSGFAAETVSRIAAVLPQVDTGRPTTLLMKVSTTQRVALLVISSGESKFFQRISVSTRAFKSVFDGKIAVSRAHTAASADGHVPERTSLKG